MGFLSTLSLRRATVPNQREIDQKRNFYPRSPCGERHCTVRHPSLSDTISIHALLAESDPATMCSTTTTTNFYPRSPCGERRYIRGNVPNFTRISIHALLAESDAPTVLDAARLNISIHALLAESDFALMISRRTFANFYPRSPCGERRLPPCWMPPGSIFLSALSLRRATSVNMLLCQGFFISIHALLAESDGWPSSASFQRAAFLSTLSLRRATAARINTGTHRQISIHALLAESDCHVRLCQADRTDFYPRSPCGERPFLTGNLLPDI